MMAEVVEAFAEPAHQPAREAAVSTTQVQDRSRITVCGSSSASSMGSTIYPIYKKCLTLPVGKTVASKCNCCASPSTYGAVKCRLPSAHWSSPTSAPKTANKTAAAVRPEAIPAMLQRQVPPASKKPSNTRLRFYKFPNTHKAAPATHPLAIRH